MAQQWMSNIGKWSFLVGLIVALAASVMGEQP